MDKIRKSEEEWKASLSPEEYRILREKGTERAFTGEYWQTKGEQGEYLCRACSLPLFEAQSKYDSGSGWPSFWQPKDTSHIEEQRDSSHGMIRTEVLCARCDAHLGHLFPDGPAPTGLRYCINSASLKFQPRDYASEGDSD